jgi:two-component system, OmpR family, sensor histidine kinase PhoQ
MSQQVPESRYSLQTRLVLAFGILLILFLGLAGFVLDRAFKESVAAAVEERLQLQVYALLGVAEPDEEGFFLPDLQDARFSQINSGLYGFILDSAGTEVWRSPSALEVNLQQANFMNQHVAPGQTVFGAMDSPSQGRLSYASYGTFWSALDQEYSFIVMESVEPTTAEIGEFQSNLYLWFGGLALFLSIAQLTLLRWGMKPLQQLAMEVSSIEAGEKDQVEHDYPPELQAVSKNLNLLIKSERERQSRYRTTLGDLAHSLKTPLAVISGIVQQVRQKSEVVDQGDKVALQELDEQLERMNQIVSYQLKRATRSEQSQHLGVTVQAVPVVEKIISALEKVYLDKPISLVKNLDAEAFFQGEESDLMELCGNLLDNAFKYCRSEIRVRVSKKGQSLQLDVEDDGQGIAEQDREWVLKRGARGDTLKSGQGIGLAVAVDIVSAYKGEISVGTSELGGASIHVRL